MSNDDDDDDDDDVDENDDDNDDGGISDAARREFVLSPALSSILRQFRWQRSDSVKSSFPSVHIICRTSVSSMFTRKVLGPFRYFVFQIRKPEIF